jgi:hypothetical protein
MSNMQMRQRLPFVSLGKVCDVKGVPRLIVKGADFHLGFKARSSGKSRRHGRLDGLAGFAPNSSDRADQLIGAARSEEFDGGRLMAMGPMFKWVRYEGERLYNGGILLDGSRHNPNDYAPELVRMAVLATVARNHERRSAAAKQAAKTRREHIRVRVFHVARRIAANQATGPARSCYVCGKSLTDAASIERGIDSECWRHLLLQVTEAPAKGACP